MTNAPSERPRRWQAYALAIVLVGIGIGWSWPYGLIGIVVPVLMVLTLHSYLRATRTVARRMDSMPWALGRT